MNYDDIENCVGMCAPRRRIGWMQGGRVLDGMKLKGSAGFGWIENGLDCIAVERVEGQGKGGRDPWVAFGRNGSVTAAQ